MLLSDVYLAGLGACVPARVTTEEAVAAGWYDAAEAEALGWRSVAVAGGTPAPDMAIEAAREALAASAHADADIDVLIHVSCNHQGPDLWSPQHYVLRHTVGGTIPALEIRQGCNGFLAAMEFASLYLTASADRTAALITSADNWGDPLVDRWRATPGGLFGDVAAACVLSRRGGFARLVNVRAVSLPELEELNRGGEPLFPPGCTTGTRVDLRERAATYKGGQDLVDAGRLMGETQRALIVETLEEAGLKPQDITRVAHQFVGDRQVLGRLLEPFGEDAADKGVWDFGRGVGHTGASDQSSALHHLVSTGAVSPGDRVMLLGAGAGISFSCAVVEILDVPAPAGA
ncbi:ketoacyl-ACP synthase III family protein [Streptomyces niveus]|uniref:Ketoacyl-ACP synthase III family protein n=1 Tax=Streptomyces niveus TaxID=193462 RepID=A0ABZ2A1V0_STRNV|nr:ketoacyl-ACP synthase III family protein [Streptomyces niveus]WTA63140.1 ketoacyl-ACP synthase III family protein [Streptomyces niveus]